MRPVNVHADPSQWASQWAAHRSLERVGLPTLPAAAATKVSVDLAYLGGEHGRRGGAGSQRADPAVLGLGDVKLAPRRQDVSHAVQRPLDRA